MKKNNKGFSLVELIIVIAIMAVLVAVLAPQYIKYVEKSRLSKDASAMSEILHAAQVAAADPGSDVVDSSTVLVKVTAAGAVTIEEPASGTASGIADDMNTLLGSGITMSSTKGKALGDLTINVNLTSGVAWDSASATKVAGLK